NNISKLHQHFVSIEAGAANLRSAGDSRIRIHNGSNEIRKTIAGLMTRTRLRICPILDQQTACRCYGWHGLDNSYGPCIGESRGRDDSLGPNRINKQLPPSATHPIEAPNEAEGILYGGIP